jgi:hypothetical protein
MRNFITFNLERHWIGEDFDPKILADDISQYFLNRITDAQAQNYLSQKFVLFATVLWESCYFRTPNFLECMKCLKKNLDQTNIDFALIIDDYYQDCGLEELDIKIYYINFFLWRTFNEIILKRRSEISHSWNTQTSKFLFLTGKSFRPNRIRLLWKFQQVGLLDRCVWSLFMNDTTKKECRGLLSNLNDQEYDKFVQENQRNPDQIKTETTHDDFFHYGGIPYDSSLFSQCKFRVISETTSINHRPFITEKTYITILNRLPFIMAGDTGTLQRLKLLGFDTFHEHLPLPEYDLIQQEEEKLDAVVENTQFWITNNMDIDSINSSIEKNYQNLITLAQHNQKILDSIINGHSLTSATYDDLCPTDFFFRNW